MHLTLDPGVATEVCGKWIAIQSFLAYPFNILSTTVQGYAVRFNKPKPSLVQNNCQFTRLATAAANYQ
jgi:hypothetical protein